MTSAVPVGVRPLLTAVFAAGRLTTLPLASGSCRRFAVPCNLMPFRLANPMIAFLDGASSSAAICAALYPCDARPAIAATLSSLDVVCHFWRIHILTSETMLRRRPAPSLAPEISAAASLRRTGHWPGHRRDFSSTQARSEEHTSELQSLMRISYAVFCLKKKNT